MDVSLLSSQWRNDSPPAMSLTTSEDDIDYEDETPFLKNDDRDILPRKPTPLPTAQISVLLSLWIAESVMDHSISPYLNQVRMSSAAECRLVCKRTPAC